MSQPASTPQKRGAVAGRDRLCCSVCGEAESANLWLCVHCGEVFCVVSEVRPAGRALLVAAISADLVFGLGAWVQGGGASACHALNHVGQDGAGCQLLLSCLDSHIYCCACSDYLYPRELSGSGRPKTVRMVRQPIAPFLRLKPSPHVPPRRRGGPHDSVCRILASNSGAHSPLVAAASCSKCSRKRQAERFDRFAAARPS
eukprot:SAG31_NODE_1452_length_8286_cov_6.329547_5_plen_201_part_00